MNQFDPKIAEAMEHAQKAQKIMTELGHTKYAICDMVSRQMLHDSEQEVSALLGKLHKVTEQRNDFKKELEIANYRLKGERHPDDNGIMADGEIDVKSLTEQRDRLETILKECLYEMPCGYVPNHTIEKLPHMIANQTQLFAEEITHSEKLEKQRDRLVDALKEYREALHDGPENCSYKMYEAVDEFAREALQSLNQPAAVKEKSDE